MASFRKGAKVHWTWGENTAHGEIVETFRRRVTRTLKGAKVTRLASEDEPAYLIKQEDGDRVLKSQSELSAG